MMDFQDKGERRGRSANNPTYNEITFTSPRNRPGARNPMDA
jgi:hypothetical protein